MRSLAFFALAAAAGTVGAHGETVFGAPANAARIDRTIEIDMSDAMRFTPAEVVVKRGESVRFVVKNSGKLVHEMVLGTMKDLEEHAEMMKKRPAMDHSHDTPSMTSVAPGKSGEIAWRFSRAGTFYYGCLVPGHFDAGMIGKIVVR